MNPADDKAEKGAKAAPESAGGEGPRVREKRTDESWKEKAREEKEKLADTAEKEEKHALPAATFLGLIDELSLRVMFALGQIREPGATEVYIDLEAAKYAIDTLAVLQAKTKGNLDREEEAGLADVLHNLRLLYVHVLRNLPLMSHDPAAGAQDPAAGGPAPPGEATPGAGGGAPGGGKPGTGEKPGPKIIL